MGIRAVVIFFLVLFILKKTLTDLKHFKMRLFGRNCSPYMLENPFVYFSVRWEKPAQHVLPELSKGGLTYQQWLERWRLAAKAS